LTASEAAGSSSFGQYDLWNAAVEAEFFDGTWQGRPVYIDMEDEALERMADLAGATGDPRAAFQNAVKPTVYLPTESGGSLLDLHLRRLNRWRMTRDPSPPPCLAMLAFFVLAAEGMRGDEHFGANNYYARLAQCLGVDPVRAPREKDRIADEFRRDSLLLWDALNSWLADHDGTLGTPTAYAFDWRSYVGVPISQALLREDERLELRKMFIEFRLDPGQELAASDMLRLLKEWLPKSDVSADLKQLFSKADAQARIADIASVELSAWDGTPPAGVVPTVDASTALLLAAQVRRVPRDQLTLSLVVRGTSRVPGGAYRLESHASEGAVAALERVAGAVQIPEPAGDGWRWVSATGPIAFPDLLIAGIRLLGPHEAQVIRKPKRLVILERDEQYRLFVEVERIQLARDSILLSHKSLASAIDGVLRECGREGWKQWSPDRLRGLPDEWVAWTNVEIMSIPDVDEEPELAALVPLEWTKIVVDGGVSLPGSSTWLRDALPEIRVTTVVEKNLSAVLEQTMSLATSDRKPTEVARFKGAVVVQLRDLDDGDYRVSVGEATQGRKPLVSTSFRVRSADSPRVAVDLEGVLTHAAQGDDPRFAISADRAAAFVPPYIAGGAAEPQVALTARVAHPPLALNAADALDLESEADIDEILTTASTAAPSCLLGGAHSYRLPDASREVMLGKERATKLDARCTQCGFEKWFPPHTRRAKAFRNTTKPVVIRATESEPPRELERRETMIAVAAITAEGGTDLNALLHALTYARGGSWALFERLASQFGEEPWFAIECARLLSALGHIDLRLDLATGRPAEWSIAEPTLLRAGPGLVLSGARSPALVERIRQDAAALDAEVHVIENANAPSTVVVESIDDSDVAELSASLVASGHASIHVNLAGAVAIAALLPSLESVAAALPTYSWPAVALERFDLDRNKWEPASALDAPGAYKFMTRPLRYAAVRADGGVVCADNRLVKWVAALDAGRSLLAYDESSRTLTARLGAQLPGLYERVAVLCSGRPPSPRVDGTVTYEGVSSEIAGALYDLLTAEDR
jgi:hypothetical protein